MPLFFIVSLANKASPKSTLQTAEVMTLLKDVALCSTPAYSISGSSQRAAVGDPELGRPFSKAAH